MVKSKKAIQRRKSVKVADEKLKGAKDNTDPHIHFHAGGHGGRIIKH